MKYLDRPKEAMWWVESWSDGHAQALAAWTLMRDWPIAETSDGIKKDCLKALKECGVTTCQAEIFGGLFEPDHLCRLENDHDGPHICAYQSDKDDWCQWT